MKDLKINFYLILVLLVTGCASIPQESVTLSETIGSDIKDLSVSQNNLISLYYRNLSGDINGFVDNVYGPFIINNVLSEELKKYRSGENSIYGNLADAGEIDADVEAIDLAASEMQDLLDAVNNIIEQKRTELLDPVESQRDSLLGLINTKYNNLIYANTSLTAYLKSLREVKKNQQRAAEYLNVKDVDQFITNNLMKTSELINKAIKASNEIDIKSTDAINKIDEISNQIKKGTQ
jgi:hypothetical protein